jgi:fission process protein 1
MLALSRGLAVGAKVWVRRVASPRAAPAAFAAAALLAASPVALGSGASKAYCQAEKDGAALKQEKLAASAAESKGQQDQPEEDEEEIATRHGLQRYAGFAATARMFLIKGIIKGKRYVAYSSDVGEAFRPILTPNMVRATYALAWTYVVGDVLYSGYLAHRGGASNKDVAITIAHAATFQTLASMLIPMFSIHTVVHQAEKICLKTGKFVKWGPSVAGLALFPLLPLIDGPVEDLVDYVFDTMFPDRRKEPGHGHH